MALIRNATGNQHCRDCGDSGLVENSRLRRGAIVNHNEAVRNYRGGPRPNFHRDQTEIFYDTCTKCEVGVKEGG